MSEANLAASTHRPLWKNVIWVLATIALVYGIVYVDVVLRARHAYLEGEKYWRWAEYPQERQAYLDKKLMEDLSSLGQKKAKGKLSEEDFQRETELLNFDHEQAAKESSIKYAYVWYQTAVELFSPPESRWVVLSRAKMPLAKERWIAELKAKNIPFEDYMVE